MDARRIVRILGLALAMLLVAAAVIVQSDGSVNLDWWTSDGGGGTSQGGDYTLSGTIGQVDTATLSGGEYVLSGGFWGGPVIRYRVFEPAVHKNSSP